MRAILPIAFSAALIVVPASAMMPEDDEPSLPSGEQATSEPTHEPPPAATERKRGERVKSKAEKERDDLLNSLLNATGVEFRDSGVYPIGAPKSETPPAPVPQSRPVPCGDGQYISVKNRMRNRERWIRDRQLIIDATKLPYRCGECSCVLDEKDAKPFRHY